MSVFSIRPERTRTASQLRLEFATQSSLSREQVENGPGASHRMWEDAFESAATMPDVSDKTAKTADRPHATSSDSDDSIAADFAMAQQPPMDVDGDAEAAAVEVERGPFNDIELEYLEVVGTNLALLRAQEGDSAALAEYKREARERLQRRTDPYRPDNICPARHRVEFIADLKSARSFKALLSPLHPLWMFLAFAFIPALTVATIFGGVPLHNPDSSDFDDYLTYALAFCPLTCCATVLLWNLQFMSTLEMHRSGSARHFVVPLLATFVAATGSVLVFLPFVPPFPAFGFIPLGASWLVFIVVMFARRTFYMPCTCTFYHQKRLTFLYIVLLTSFLFVIFVGYTLIYRQLPAAGQKALSGGWVFVLLFIKKGMLSITETLPYFTSMLLSGFQLQNMSDVFFVMVYPNIQDPKSTFIIIFFIISGTDYLYLIFMTHWWFVFRVWIKARLKALFCCRRYDPALAAPLYDDVDLDDRGQTNCRPGYLRRQIQFFYYRVASGITAQIFFLVASPIFRYWNNAEYFPLSGVVNASTVYSFSEPIPENNYRNAMIYSGARLGTLLLLIPISTAVILYLAKRELYQLIPKYRQVLKSPRFIMQFGTCLFTNLLLCCWMALSHNEIWFIDID